MDDLPKTIEPHKLDTLLAKNEDIRDVFFHNKEEDFHTCLPVGPVCIRLRSTALTFNFNCQDIRTPVNTADIVCLM